MAQFHDDDAVPGLDDLSPEQMRQQARAMRRRIAIEPKPNEPMDMSYITTIGHGVALGYQTNHPARMGVLMESAHAILAGLDPSDEISFAMACGKLWSVHLNDQNGPLALVVHGLYISRRLIEAMGGKIWVESSGIPGEGSSFCVQLQASS